MPRIESARSVVPLLSAYLAASMALGACTASLQATGTLTPKPRGAASDRPTGTKPAATKPAAPVGAVLSGVVQAPPSLIGNDSAGLIGNDSAGLIGKDGATLKTSGSNGALIGNDTAGAKPPGGVLVGNDGASLVDGASLRSLAALGQVPVVRAKVTLADASGTPIPGAPEVETDVMGRFTFPGKLPKGYGFHLIATVPTAKGGVAKLHAMASPGEGPVMVGVPGTLVTLALVEGRGASLAAVDGAAFTKAQQAANAQLKLEDLPDLADEAAMKAFAIGLAKRVSAMEEAVGKMADALDALKVDVAAFRADMDVLAKEVERLTPPPKMALAQEIPVGAAPRTLRFDAQGVMWVACYKDASVNRVTPDGKVTTIPVGESPLGMDFGPDGDLWVASYEAGTVARIAPDGTLKGSFPCGANPFGVVVDPAGHVWVANYKAKTVTELDAAGAILGAYPTGPRPFGLARDAAGGMWVTSNAGHGVTKLGAAPGKPGQGFMTDRAPSMITFDAKGDAWVTSTGSDRLTRLSATGEALGSFDTGGDEPWGLAIAPDGDLWVTNTSGATKTDINEAMRPQSIARFGPDGARKGLWFLPDSPQGVAFDAQGRPWVALRDANKVVRLAP